MSAPPVYPGYPPTPPPTPPTPQYPVQPSYPVAPGQLPGYQQPYAPQQFAPQYPQAQGYPAPQMAPPQQPLAQGSIDDFFNQPSAGGGKSLSFKVIGTRYRGIVTRPLGRGDVQQQTDTMRRPLTYNDGRPKFVMKVPLQMQPSAEHPDGLATWFVKGQARDELVRAMAEAGAPAGPPEANSIIDISYVADRQSGQGLNPAKQFQIVYTRPGGAAQQPAPQAAPPIPAQVIAPPAAVPQAAPQPDPAQQAAMAAVQQQFPQATPVQQPAAPAVPGQYPADFTPDQVALMQRLAGGAPQA